VVRAGLGYRHAVGWSLIIIISEKRMHTSQLDSNALNTLESKDHEPRVYLNGAFLPLSEAKVPVLDRGFIFGDGIYEVVPVYARRLFRWPEHLARLKRSLAKIRIDNPYSDSQWLALIESLIQQHPWSEQFVYLHITRGVAKRDHAFPKASKPTVFAMTSALQAVPQHVRREGVAAITLDDQRWLHCDIKSISLLGNVLARQAAVDADAAECIQFRDGQMTEGSSSNIWLVRHGEVLGAPVDHRILEGIRVGLMETLCHGCGIGFRNAAISREELFQADELLLTSATKEVLAITKVDHKPVGEGKPGPVYHRLYQAAIAANGANPQAIR
jgi:D-alanine transaminase